MGTPAGELLGVPHTGKSFKIMAIDIQTNPRRPGKAISSPPCEYDGPAGRYHAASRSCRTTAGPSILRGLV